MNAKGFRDEDGNEVVVPGAGVRYNAELNATAVGKKTSAIGRDQLVFGRYNVEDADKAEIVGAGGAAFSHVKITGTVHRSSDEHQYDVEVIASIPVAKSSYDFEQDVEVPSAVKTKVSESDWFSEVGKVESVTGLEETGFTYYYITGILHTTWQNEPYVMMMYYDENEQDAYTLGIMSDFHIEYVDGQAPKNIRTLDWEGNEELAGGLTAGGDVKCNDGEEGEISLRETAAKADELETALDAKMDKMLTLQIDADASDDPATYPMTATADALLSAFVDGVSANTEVPVLVKLYERSTSLGTVIGVAKWTLEGQEDEHDVTIRLGRLLFSTSRQFDGQQQWGTFTDWTKTSSQDIDEFFS